MKNIKKKPSEFNTVSNIIQYLLSTSQPADYIFFKSSFLDNFGFNFLGLTDAGEYDLFILNLQYLIIIFLFLFLLAGQLGFY